MGSLCFLEKLLVLFHQPSPQPSGKLSQAHVPERLQGLGVTGVVGGGGSGSPRMKTGFLGSAGPEPGPSSSEEKANLGMVSKLTVLRRDGLGPRSG